MKLVAEVGINHNGDIDIARCLIDQARAAGWHYVKFQKRTVRRVIPKGDWDKPKDTPYGIMPYIAYKEMLEFDETDYELIDKHCQLHRLEWFASPWDVDSVTFLQQWECPYIKVASACLTNHDLLHEIRRSMIPIIISTGLSDKLIFDKAWDIVGPNVEYILACTGTYPSKPAEQNLAFIKTLKQEYGTKVGFSNHSPGILYAAAAVCYGAEMIECHVTLDRSMWGSDQAASIEPEGMHKLAKYVAGLGEAIGSGNWEFFEREKQVAAKLRKTQ